MPSTTSRGRPSSATVILDAACRMLDGGAALSLESVARAAGVSKPGLMYHFPTKSALMSALVDHVIDVDERDIQDRLEVPADQATPRQRLRAYLLWAFETDHRRSDLVIFSDPKLATEMAARWTERMGRWFSVPTDLPAEERAQLHAARLMADGAWWANVSDTFPLDDHDQAALLAVALNFLKEEPR
jgi:AcrR family transcriptional regulator